MSLSRQPSQYSIPWLPSLQKCYVKSIGKCLWRVTIWKKPTRKCCLKTAQRHGHGDAVTLRPSATPAPTWLKLRILKKISDTNADSQHFKRTYRPEVKQGYGSPLDKQALYVHHQKQKKVSNEKLYQRCLRTHDTIISRYQLVLRATSNHELPCYLWQTVCKHNGMTTR